MNSVAIRPFVTNLTVEKLANISFFAWCICEVLFSHSIISRISLYLFCGLVIILILQEKRIHFGLILFFSLAFIVYNHLILSNSIFISETQSMIKTLFISFLFYFCLYNYVSLSDDIYSIIKIYRFAGLVLALYCFGMYLASGFQGRMGGSFDVNANSLAIPFSFAFLFYFNSFLAERKAKRYLLAMAILLFVIFLTGSRKGLLGIVIGIVIVIQLFYPRKFVRNAIVLTVILILGYILLMKVTFFYDLVGIRMEALMAFVFEDGTAEASLSSRSDYTDLAWEYIALRPWTGYGLNTFHTLRESYGTYSHNNITEVLFSSGIFGFILFYFPLAIETIKSLITGIKKDKIGILFFAVGVIVFILGYALVFYYSRSILALFIMAAGWMKSLKNRDDDKVNINQSLQIKNGGP